ncbi:hypothetical protein LbDm2_2202 [Levilactobacillus brevis]|nr:hypothetical protein LbDm2_2202 [Levilactobacillus brevis]
MSCLLHTQVKTANSGKQINESHYSASSSFSRMQRTQSLSHVIYPIGASHLVLTCHWFHTRLWCSYCHWLMFPCMFRHTAFLLLNCPSLGPFSLFCHYLITSTRQPLMTGFFCCCNASSIFHVGMCPK